MTSLSLGVNAPLEWTSCSVAGRLELPGTEEKQLSVSTHRETDRKIQTDRLKPVTSLLCYQQSSKQIYLRNNPVIHHTRVSLIPPVMEAVLIRWSIYYRPQRSCGKIMFLHLSVILFTGGPDTPLGRNPLGRQAPGRHPLGRHLPQADTPLGRHPQETTTAADGTHPTGMHSCSSVVLHVFSCLRLCRMIRLNPHNLMTPEHITPITSLIYLSIGYPGLPLKVGSPSEPVTTNLR